MAVVLGLVWTCKDTALGAVVFKSAKPLSQICGPANLCYLACQVNDPGICAKARLKGQRR